MRECLSLWLPNSLKVLSWIISKSTREARDVGLELLAEDGQFLKPPLNASVGRCIASNHERGGGFGRLVRVAGVKGGRRVSGAILA